ncbi:MAG: glycosyltransferase 87 family protein [Candidatus Methylomirabilales bacterium]
MPAASRPDAGRAVPAGREAAPRKPALRPRWVAPAFTAAVLGVLYAWNFDAVRLLAGPDGRALFAWYPVYFGLAFLAYLAGVRLTWHAGPRAAALVILIGLAFRLGMLATPVVLSSDLFRYLWDGRVQLAGINPYLHAPAADALAPLRDVAIHPLINRPEARTVYPPGAQALFLALAWLAPDSLVALRLGLALGELLSMLLLLALLRHLGLPEGRVAVYAWAPLAVLEIGQAAHIEGAMLPMVLGALLARIRGRHGLAGALLGGAALVKLYPAILLPALWRRGDRRLPLAFGATLVLGYLPYLATAGDAIPGFLPLYFSRFEDFNIGLRALLTHGLGFHGRVARGVAMALLAAAFGVTLLAIRRQACDTHRGVARAAGSVIAAHLVLLPTALHPWYVVWLVPFLGMMPAPGLWYLTGAVALSYTGYTAEPSHVPAWVRALEFVPVYAGLLLTLCTRRRPAPAGSPVRERMLWWTGTWSRSSPSTSSR